jgi:hypothetical protein
MIFISYIYRLGKTVAKCKSCSTTLAVMLQAIRVCSERDVHKLHIKFWNDYNKMKRYSLYSSGIVECSTFSVPIQNVIINIAYFKHLEKFPWMEIGSSQSLCVQWVTQQKCAAIPQWLEQNVNPQSQCSSVPRPYTPRPRSHYDRPRVLVTYDGIKSRINSGNASREWSRNQASHSPCDS